MVLLSAQGMDVPAIARVAFTSEDRVRDVIRNFSADGFSSLYPRYRGGGLPKFDGQVLTHGAFSRPSQRATRQLRPRPGAPAGVLAPHMPAARAAIAATRQASTARLGSSRWPATCRPSSSSRQNEPSSGRTKVA
jgi:hypothetical protein